MRIGTDCRSLVKHRLEPVSLLFGSRSGAEADEQQRALEGGRLS